jgi:hypothetical protein
MKARGKAAGSRKPRTPRPTVEQRVRDYAIEQVECALSFESLAAGNGLDLDELAKDLLERDRRAGANVHHVKVDEDSVLRQSLPEDLQMRFRNYVDSIEGMALYFAQAGYILGLEVGKRLGGGVR